MLSDGGEEIEGRLWSRCVSVFISQDADLLLLLLLLLL